jgi:hypothetical protein
MKKPWKLEIILKQSIVKTRLQEPLDSLGLDALNLTRVQHNQKNQEGLKNLAKTMHITD